MNIIAITIACAILFVGAYIGKKDINNFAQDTAATKSIKHSDVLSSEEDLSEQSERVQKTDNEIPTTTPYTTPIVSSGIDSFRYPNSDIISGTDVQLLLQSSAPVDDITNWYKEKLRSEDMNIKTFVRTSANNTVLNKLSASDFNDEIYVEIKKNPSDDFCVITVKFNQKL